MDVYSSNIKTNNFKEENKMKGKKEKRYFCDWYKKWFEHGSLLDPSDGMYVLLLLCWILCILFCEVAGIICFANETRDNFYDEVLYQELEEYVSDCIKEKDLKKLLEGVDDYEASFTVDEIELTANDWIAEKDLEKLLASTYKMSLTCEKRTEHCIAKVTTTISLDLEMISQKRDISSNGWYNVSMVASWILCVMLFCFCGIVAGVILALVLRIVIKIASILSRIYKRVDTKKVAEASNKTKLALIEQIEYKEYRKKRKKYLKTKRRGKQR